jgi:hypothetical protein
MDDLTETVRTRELGVECGPLAEKLTTHEYPATCTDLLDAYENVNLHLPNGAQPLRDVLDPLQGEQFDSPEEVRQAVLRLVSKQAIGRECYSDPTPPALGEEAERAPDSF